jgi:omega-6 fatty acid desaturase (delta-12 desaturase)
MKALIAAVPRDCLLPSTTRSLLTLARDLLLFAAIAAAIVFVHRHLRPDAAWLAALPLAVLQGTVLTGLFVVGHECGHGSFSLAPRLNRVVGELTAAMAFWPYEVWRLSHELHHRHTHNIGKDIAWVPFTAGKYGRLGWLARTIYLETRTRLFFIGSAFFTFYFIKDGLRGRRSRHFKAQELPAIRRSLAILALVLAAYVTAAWSLAGAFGVVWLFVIPQLVFQMWLSTFTLLHHTHPERRFLAPEEWAFAPAQLHATVHVRFPRLVEWLTHDINWHVPHHVCVGIPHYRLRRAHAALKTAFPSILEETFGWSLVRRVVRDCQMIASKEPAGLAWSPAPRIGTARLAQD